MLKPSVEEALEKLYLHEAEGGDYPEDEESLEGLKEASSLGVVEAAGERFRFTKSGVSAGRDVVRRHRLAERLLKDVLAVKPDELEDDACQFEHILEPGLEESICVLLGHPATCPHGHPIPEGECCRKARKDPISEVSPLCDGRPGAEGVVAYLSTRESREVQKMMAMGILPGVGISLLRRFPSYVLQVGYSQFTLDRALAEMIYVRWQAPKPGPGREERPDGKGPRRRWRWPWRRR